MSPRPGDLAFRQWVGDARGHFTLVLSAEEPMGPGRFGYYQTAAQTRSGGLWFETFGSNFGGGLEMRGTLIDHSGRCKVPSARVRCDRMPHVENAQSYYAPGGLYVRQTRDGQHGALSLALTLGKGDKWLMGDTWHTLETSAVSAGLAETSWPGVRVLDLR